MCCLTKKNHNHKLKSLSRCLISINRELSTLKNAKKKKEVLTCLFDSLRYGSNNCFSLRKRMNV